MASGFTISFTVLALFSAVSPQQLPQPSEEHKVLAQDVGDWSITGRILMPTGFQEFKGEEKVVAIGKFWTVSHYSSDAMGGLKGSATIGFDSKTKKFEGKWVDSFMPFPTRMKGTYDPKTKKMTYETTGVGMDGKPMPGRIIVHYKSKNSHTFTMMHRDPTGQSDKMVTTMESTYTRKKSQARATKN